MGKRTRERTMTEDARIRLLATQVLVKGGVNTPEDVDVAYRYLDDVAVLEEAEGLGDAIHQRKHGKLFVRAIEAARRLAA